MVRKCSIPGCKSNYDSTPKHVSTFQFPTDKRLRKAWINAIPRENWVPSKHSAVCYLHFAEECFAKKPNKRRRLKDDAIPTIFNNYPACLSKILLCNTSLKVVKREVPLKNDDEINDFENFLSKIDENVKFDGWLLYKNSSYVVLYFLKEESHFGCKFKYRIKIDSNLKVSCFSEITEIPVRKFENVLPLDMKLTLWSQLKKLIIFFDSNSDIVDQELDSQSNLLGQALRYLNNFKKANSSFKKSKQLDTVIDQIKLLIMKIPRYSCETIVMSFLIFAHSKSTYLILSEFLTLPSKRHLQRLSSTLHSTPTYRNDENDDEYIADISQSLTEREKIVAILIEEIHIDQYKVNTVPVKSDAEKANSPTKSSKKTKTNNASGKPDAEILETSNKNNSEKADSEKANNAPKTAKTILAYMVKSVFGNFKKIIRLYPVANPTEDYLVKTTKSVIDIVQNKGFHVLVIISDNIKTNQGMYSILTGENENFFPNPNGKGNIYLLYDTVNLFKNIRNNWMYAPNMTFLFSDFDTHEMKHANFAHIRELFQQEESYLIKKAYKLNKKTLFPSRNQRQNVELVDNIFHHSTIETLKEIEKMQSTADFCEVIKKWWDICNTKEKFSGDETNDEWNYEISEVNDFRLSFLTKFCDWLSVWNFNENNSRLSNDTFNGLVFTTKTLIDIVNLSLTELNIDYILLGKFQSDDLKLILKAE
ncbi:uncharacterized protein LOC129610592 [Condylostylus longicornis]|uniref:uncharacterized protein LOC129610592 n=1 Tax=Condylostylus longicornis TaxID=2530218 RepID=UPI00244E4A94|nr:uncharacterized protein LOC129610592 [Condylostylus longicornis]